MHVVTQIFITTVTLPGYYWDRSFLSLFFCCTSEAWSLVGQIVPQMQQQKQLVVRGDQKRK